MTVKVMVAVNTAWNLVNFRSGLIRALIAAGYEVIAVAPSDEYAEKLPEIGCRFVHLQMDNYGTHPGRDLMLLRSFLAVMRAERPDVYLGYTVKPNIYGSFAAHSLGIPVINNISGLGTAFIKGGWLASLVGVMYRLALACSTKVFFQNDDDRQMFVTRRLVDESVSSLLPGSGIDLLKFAPASLPNKTTLRFLLIARMLVEKGVGEFVEAARLLKRRGVNAEFCLLGSLEQQNASSITAEQMAKWTNEGSIQYLGVSDDVRGEIIDADCVVLPSYREGTPRALLEAAAMARPIVTTNSVGCREVVDDGINGFLCQPRDALDLADKLEQMASKTAEERRAMGLRGREKAERQFDEQIVINAYLQAIKSLLDIE